MHTAHSDEWRPGFAKRADNFGSVCAQAEGWRWRPGETIARVAAAVLKGTPTLTAPQRLTLMLYVEHLNQERLEQDIACVWPSTTLIAEYLGCSASSARSNRRALEAAGYLVRDYNHANRPAGLEAYDLRPLMARLDELEGFDASVREAAVARRAAYSEGLIFPTRYSAQAPESRRLEQSQKNFSSPVTEKKDADSPRRRSFPRSAKRTGSVKELAPSATPQRGRTPSGNSSPGRANGFGSNQPSPSAHAEMVRQELQTAVRVCPRLAALVGDNLLADPAGATPEDAARIIAAGPLLLPEAERNNELSVEWGWNRHGVRIIAMLAIALEDAKVRNPCKYFGWMATRDPVGAPDLRVNLRRLLVEKGDIPPAEKGPASEVAPTAPTEPPSLMFAPGIEDSPWPEINTELRRLIKDGAHGSWFSRVGFHGLEDGVLILSAPMALTAVRIKQDYIPAIMQAAENVGVFVERVSLTIRKR